MAAVNSRLVEGHIRSARRLDHGAVEEICDGAERLKTEVAPVVAPVSRPTEIASPQPASAATATATTVVID